MEACLQPSRFIIHRDLANDRLRPDILHEIIQLLYDVRMEIHQRIMASDCFICVINSTSARLREKVAVYLSLIARFIDSGSIARRDNAHTKPVIWFVVISCRCARTRINRLRFNNCESLVYPENHVLVVIIITIVLLILIIIIMTCN